MNIYELQQVHNNSVIISTDIHKGADTHFHIHHVNTQLQNHENLVSFNVESFKFHDIYHSLLCIIYSHTA